MENLNRTCKKCGEFKPLTPEHFRFAPDGRSSRHCLACHKIADGKQYAMRKYGISQDEYELLSVRACALCGSTKRLVIDHCHKRGYVRDRLCTSCNTGLGMFMDRPAVLRKAAEYIEEHAWKHCQLEWEKIKQEYP